MIGRENNAIFPSLVRRFQKVDSTMKCHNLLGNKFSCMNGFFKATALMLALFFCAGGSVAQTQKSDSVYYVYRNDGGGVFAIPDSLVKSYKKSTYYHRFFLPNDSVISFSCSLPQMSHKRSSSLAHT